MNYPHRPVNSMNALALALSVPKGRLGHHFRSKSRYFTLHESLNAAEDPNSRKIWYAPHPDLKALHRQLNKAFLNQVTLPAYIVGGVTGRSYADACRLHANSKSVIRLDIEDRKSTRLNSSHVAISYAVFCLKKKRDEM